MAATLQLEVLDTGSLDFYYNTANAQIQLVSFNAPVLESAKSR